ncbi:hypothetical protein ColLi_00930 [Colletotrichum liriopes]|uniref:Uncharacterized protein n=1 Tax=Colletotrichum liriopes TaxID=708192 RepID=A0AA37GCM0_9PEZI|nr:hypothetical protein ColLi_00930 [Colletotrichum liriopes]
MPDSNRGTNIRGRGAARGSIAGSDAQVLTGASPVSTPTQERPDPIVRQDRVQTNGDDHPRSEHDRSRREHRSERGRHSRRGSRERERSPDREREAKEPREHRDRRSGAQSQSSTREEREPRRSGPEKAWVAAASRVIAVTAGKVDVEREVRADEAKNGVEVRVAHLEQGRVREDRGRPTIDASRARTEAESGGAKTPSVFQTTARRGRDVRSLRLGSTSRSELEST